MKITYTLKDTFNDLMISRHRSVLAAVRAKRRHLADVKRRNGPDSYLTYAIAASDGSDISDEIMAANEHFDFSR